MATTRHDGSGSEDGQGPAADERASAPEGGPAPGSDPGSTPAVETDPELREARERYLRLAADFENFKKRARLEQMETIQHAAAMLAERLLPVLDDAELALSHAPAGTDEGWLKGVRLTFQKLQDALLAVGVERIEAVGAAFDPKLHEAIGSEESAEHAEDTVLVELRPGYRMHDRVLRPSLVKVSRRKP